MSSLKTYKEEIFEREELEKIEKKGLLKVLKKVKLPKQVLKADSYTQKSTQHPAPVKQLSSYDI